MMRAPRWIIPVVLIALTGCSGSEPEPSDDTSPTTGQTDGTDTGADTGTDTGDDSPSTDTGSTDGTDDTDPVGPGDDDNLDNLDPTANDKACGPARRDQMAKMAHDLFERAMEVDARGCALDRIELDEDGDGTFESAQSMDLPTEMECDSAGNCERTLPGFAWAWSQESEQGFGLGRVEMYEGRVEGRHLIVDGAETIELSLGTQVTGSTADRRVDRVYDGAGRLLSEAYYFGTNLWFEIFNKWEEDHLVEQRYVDIINTNTHESVSSWTYDDEGRMLTSLLETHQGATRGASFAYDDEGRLMSAERSSDGATWLNQSWSYEGGVLVSRSNTFTTNYWYESADESMVLMPDGYSSNWEQSLTRVNGDCELPPISLLHGYPDEESVYQLGWSRDEVPNQVGFAYGYNGFGWNYGDLSWFGHGGIATYYGPDYWTEGTEVTVEMNYVDGVMVEEVVDYQRPASEGDELVNVVRSREVEAGHITRDIVTTTLTRGDETETSTQTLAFQYDASGNLTERELYFDDAYTHMAYWTYDGDNRITEHGIYGTGQLWGSPEDEDTTDTELPHMSTYRQTITEMFVNYERIREQRGFNSDEWHFVDSFRRGQHERGTFETGDYGFVVYDIDGRMVMDGHGDPEDPDYFDAWTEDEHGLLGTWEVGSPDGLLVRSYVHSCAE